MIATFPSCNPKWRARQNDREAEIVSHRRQRCHRHRIRLIAAGIAVAIITVVPAIGTKLNTAFTKIDASLP
jgi:hypothetical protein